jgi:hypothetical protein
VTDSNAFHKLPEKDACDTMHLSSLCAATKPSQLVVANIVFEVYVK